MWAGKASCLPGRAGVQTRMTDQLGGRKCRAHQSPYECYHPRNRLALELILSHLDEQLQLQQGKEGKHQPTDSQLRRWSR